jgi:uncharacterized protein
MSGTGGSIGGLSLADGVPVLESDPLAMSKPDPHPDGDHRQTVGSASGLVVLFVVQTGPIEHPDGTRSGRVISATKATSHEREAFEEGAF